MTNRQTSKGDNSPNNNAARDINIQNYYNTLNNDEMPKILPKNKLANVVQVLIDKYLEFYQSSSENYTIESLPVRDEIKIAYNQIPNYGSRFYLIADVDSVNTLCNIFDDLEDPSALNVAKSAVKHAFLDELLEASKDSSIDYYGSNPKSKRYDYILQGVHKKLKSKVASACTEYDDSQLDSSIDLIIYQVFRECMILDRPPDTFIEQYQMRENNDSCI